MDAFERRGRASVSSRNTTSKNVDIRFSRPSPFL